MGEYGEEPLPFSLSFLNTGSYCVALAGLEPIM